MLPAESPAHRTLISWPPADRYALLLILQLWLVALIIINPTGDFPIADDWAYFSSVKALVEHGSLVYSDWAAPNLVSQFTWGALFALPFGVSYTVLRISTEVLALIAAGALYLTLRNFGCRPGVALVGALTLLFNPLAFVLSASFMSDVPYTAMQTVAILFLTAGFAGESAIQLKLGWWATIAALLCRQVGMAIPLGFGAARLSRAPFEWQNALLAFLPFAGFLALQILFQTGLGYAGILPAHFGRQIGFMLSNMRNSGFLQLSGGLLWFAVECAYYLGFFLLPLSLLVVAQFTNRIVRELALSVWGWLLAVSLLLTWFGPQMPVWSNNIIEAWSLGGVDVIGVPPPGWFWPIITFLSAFGALTLIVALLVTGLMVGWQTGKTPAAVALFAGVTALALLGSLALLPRGTQFDRYIIPVVPCLVIFLCMRLRASVENTQPIPAWARATGAATLAVLAVYSVLGTHDFLAEKRAQWVALQDLIQQDHVLPDVIDAGWVYNAPTSYGVYGDPNRIDTWFRSREFLVFSERIAEMPRLTAYSRIRTYPVSRWAPWAQAPGSIVVMHRNNPRAR